MGRSAQANFKEDLGIGDINVIKDQLRMIQHYGYLPAYAANIPDLATAAQNADFLLHQYPGYQWKVQVRDKLLTCINETLHPTFGFNIRLKDLDNDGRLIRRYGAGLLERFAQAEKFVEDNYSEAKKDLRGNVLYAN